MNLTKAFKDLNIWQIIKLSTDIGHYIGDLNVPLHTTSDYDGQNTGQMGIHALWETRLLELFKDNFNYFVGRAKYISDPMQTIWETVLKTHKLIKNLLLMDRKTAEKVCFGTHIYKNCNGYSKRVFSKAYSKEYYKKLDGQVERQLLNSIKMVGDFWYTCWVDAGSPDLSEYVLMKQNIPTQGFETYGDENIQGDSVNDDEKTYPLL